MGDFVKLIKGSIAIGVLSALLANIAYILGMFSGLIARFYNSFCYIGVSGDAIASVSSLTSGFILAFFVIALYRTFYGF